MYSVYVTFSGIYQPYSWLLMYGCAFDKMKLFYLVLTNARPFFCNEKWKRRRNSQNGIMGKNLSKLIQKSITGKECNPI